MIVNSIRTSQTPDRNWGVGGGLDSGADLLCLCFFNSDPLLRIFLLFLPCNGDLNSFRQAIRPLKFICK